MLQWFALNWSSLFAQFHVIMYCYCCVLMTSSMFSAIAHFMDPPGSTWFYKYSFISWAPRFSPYQCVIFSLLSSSSCHFTCFLPLHYGCIFKFFAISWYLCVVWSHDDTKRQGSSHDCKVDFISEGGEARPFSTMCCSDGLVRVFTLLSQLPKGLVLHKYFFHTWQLAREILHFSLNVLLFWPLRTSAKEHQWEVLSN